MELILNHLLYVATKEKEFDKEDEFKQKVGERLSSFKEYEELLNFLIEKGEKNKIKVKTEIANIEKSLEDKFKHQMKLKEQELNKEFQQQKQKNETSFLRLSKMSDFLEKMLNDYLISQNIYFEFNTDQVFDILQSGRLKFINSGYLEKLENDNKEANMKQNEEFNILKYQIKKMKENYEKKSRREHRKQ